MRYLLYLLYIFLLFGGCSDTKEATSGVSPVHWDRDMCKRCKMVVSDRKHSVQVKDPKGRVYMFDDIGCMILWFEERRPAWRDSARIFITDSKFGEWIDAKRAWYDTGNVTPMAFGFAAHKQKKDIDKGKEILSFDEVRERILHRVRQ